MKHCLQRQARGETAPGSPPSRAGAPSDRNGRGADRKVALLLGDPLARGRAAAAGTVHAPAIVHEVLRSPGAPLDAAVAGEFSAAFGYDFSAVRVHADARAAASAMAVDARAYTVGRNIVFGAGAFAPRTAPGRRLLAHELAHVVQQGLAGRFLQRACACGKPAKNGGQCEECKRKSDPILQRSAVSDPVADFARIPAALPRLRVNEPGDALEREAEAAAEAVLAGRFAAVSQAAPARVQREGAGIIPSGPLDLGDTSAARNRKLPERRPGTPHGTSEVLDPSPAPCLRGARCHLAIAGSNMDFADAARAAESKSEAELRQKGESVELRPAAEMTQFMRASAAPAARWIREVLVDPSMGGEGSAGAWHGPCPDDAKAACITVAASWEDEAREFNTKPDAATIGDKTRAQWRFTTLQMMSHEAAHERFERGSPAGTSAFTGRRHRSTLSHKELSELFAQLSEFQVFYGEHMSGDDPMPEKLRRLRDDYGARYLDQGQEISENIPGIVMRLRCLNPCAEVDAMLRANFAAASSGWSPAVRQALLTLLTDPAYGIHWPAPRQPGWSLRPEPEALRFGANQLQREAAGPHVAPAEVPPLVHEVLRASGVPLDAAVRARFEPRFGHDFSRVRVHMDERAAASARAVQANAYTVGRNIVFARGAYAPGTPDGQRLLAHELAHVVQQGQAGRFVRRDATDS